MHIWKSFFFKNGSAYPFQCLLSHFILSTQCRFKWDFKLLECINLLSHIGQLYRASPVWVRICSLMYSLRLNLFKQTQHSKGLSPVWIRLCCLRWHFIAKAFSHWSHLKGLSLECFKALCLRRIEGCAKAALHWEQTCGLSPVWLNLCFLRPVVLLNAKSHWSHL